MGMSDLPASGHSVSQIAMQTAQFLALHLALAPTGQDNGRLEAKKVSALLVKAETI